MKENLEEQYARMVLEAHKFEVERIPEKPNTRRADFRVRKGDDEFLLEVTNKRQTEFHFELLSSAAQKGISTATRKIEYWNRLAAIFRDKADQLNQTPTVPTAFRVLWFSALHNDHKFVLECAKIVAYGLRQRLVVKNLNTMPYATPCFFYDRSTFYTTPCLDAIVLADAEGGRLCINPFSEKREAFRRSALAEMFPDKAKVDAEIWERQGHALILDGSFDYADDRSKWQRLYDKYGVRTSDFTEHQFVSFVSGKVGT